MFDSMLAAFRERDHRFVVYTDAGTPTENWFANHTVVVERRALPSCVPEPFLTVERDGEFVGVLSLATVDRLLEPPIVRPEDDDGLSPAYRALFEVLDETVYTSMNRAELLAVSREIEDRALRTAGGVLHAGFQRLSVFRTRIPTYRRLAAAGVEVHVHGLADWEPPPIEGVTYHRAPPGTLDRFWVLAFDGGRDPCRSCGLLAREESDGYSGFWTDDASAVAAIRRELAAPRN